MVSVALRKDARIAAIRPSIRLVGSGPLSGRAPHPCPKRYGRYRMSKFAVRHPVGLGIGVATFLLLCVLSLYASWEAQAASRRMAEDHQLASTFLVEVHDAIVNLPGATPAREKLLRKSLDYLNGLTRDAGEDPGLHRALATAYEKFAELQAGAVGAGLGQSFEALETNKKAQMIREMLAKGSPDRCVQFDLAETIC